jgi:FixJ family two-component response regulator
LAGLAVVFHRVHPAAASAANHGKAPTLFRLYSSPIPHYREEMTRAAHQTHVALLDDDPSFRSALARLLKAEGMVVSPHATGDQLFAALALEHPDCLILDLQMPRISGLDVLNQLRESGVRIPTIILTAQREAESLEACLNAGAIACLHKPVNADVLLQTINRALA